MILELRQQLCFPEIVPVLFGFLNDAPVIVWMVPITPPPGNAIIIQVSKSDQFLDVVTIQLGSQKFFFLSATEILQIKQ